MDPGSSNREETRKDIRMTRQARNGSGDPALQVPDLPAHIMDLTGHGKNDGCDQDHTDQQQPGSGDIPAENLEQQHDETENGEIQKHFPDPFILFDLALHIRIQMQRTQ